MKTNKGKNAKFVVTSSRIDLHHKLQVLIQICFLLDYLLLFLRFLLLADFLFLCLFAGKDIVQKPLFSNPEIPCPANKYLFKVSDKNPKTRAKVCQELTVEIALFIKNL